jgi:hypothetical protein
MSHALINRSPHYAEVEAATTSYASENGGLSGRKQIAELSLVPWASGPMELRLPNASVSGRTTR